LSNLSPLRDCKLKFADVAWARPPYGVCVRGDYPSWCFQGRDRGLPLPGGAADVRRRDIPPPPPAPGTPPWQGERFCGGGLSFYPQVALCLPGATHLQARWACGGTRACTDGHGQETRVGGGRTTGSGTACEDAIYHLPRLRRVPFLERRRAVLNDYCLLISGYMQNESAPPL
jgi:hypothetical protein